MQRKTIIVLFVISVAGLLYYKSNLYAPILGKYDPAEYNFFKILYEFPIVNLELPQQLQAAYPPNFDLNNPANTEFYSIKVWGGVQEPGIYNVAFHPDVQRWVNEVDPNRNISMGLFAPNGVEAVGGGNAIPFNQFGLVNVHKHGAHYSPDNAQFRIMSGRNVVTFWTAALYENNTVITYNVIILDAAMQNSLSNRIEELQYENPDARNTEIAFALANEARNLDGVDGAALSSAVERIISMITL